MLNGAAGGAGSARFPLGPFVFFFSAALFMSSLGLALFGSGPFLTRWFLSTQDVPALLLAVLIAFVAVLPVRPEVTEVSADGRHVLVLAVALILVGYFGHFWLLSGYDMSRDEQMATFDAMVYGQGKLVQPVPPFWQGNIEVLNTLFMSVQSGSVAWLSSYLPVNSAVRALFGAVSAPELANPTLAALGAVALWRCVERLWPGDKAALAIALLFYGMSAQVLVTSMTSYAMTGHLALNLVWLALFLREDRWGDAGAIAVAFLATGLHQPVPHPLFAAPFLLALGFANKRRGAAFVMAYALIGLFWLGWPQVIAPMLSVTGGAAEAQNGDFIGRMVALFTHRDSLGLFETCANLLRFVAWQHVLAVPLALIGMMAARRDRVAMGLVGGVALTVLFMAVVLPYQGHGFGYRYLHGLIGNVALLAVYGWKRLEAHRATLQPVLLRTSLATVGLMLPLQAFFAHSFYAPYAEARMRILALEADYAVVPVSGVAFAGDLVFNPPELDQKPILLMEPLLYRAGFIGRLCEGAPVVAVVPAEFLEPIARYYSDKVSPQHTTQNANAAEQFVEAGCKVLK